MSYCKSKNCWTGLERYSLNSKKTVEPYVEPYVAPVTMPWPAWQQYVASGNNILLGSGCVIPGGTVQMPFGGGSAVYKGHVRQGWYGA